MKNYQLVGCFIAVHTLLIVLQIHKSSLRTQQSFKQQKLENEKTALIKQRQKLIHQLQAQTTPKKIKQYALKKGMHQLKIGQIKKLPEQESVDERSV